MSDHDEVHHPVDGLTADSPLAEDAPPSTGVPQPEDPAATADQKLVECAFLVFMDDNGHWVANGDMSIPIRSRRMANLNDMFIGSSVVLKDITVMETAQQTVQFQQQAAAAMMAQVQAGQTAQAAGVAAPGAVLLDRRG
jgi:hypothetical protein